MSEISTSIYMLYEYENYGLIKPLIHTLSHRLTYSNMDDAEEVPQKEIELLDEITFNIQFYLYNGSFLLLNSLGEYHIAFQIMEGLIPVLEGFKKGQTVGWNKIKQFLDGVYIHIMNKANDFPLKNNFSSSFKNYDLLKQVFKARVDIEKVEIKDQENCDFNNLIPSALLKYILSYVYLQNIKNYIDINTLNIKKTRFGDFNIGKIFYSLKENVDLDNRSLFIFLNKFKIIEQIRIFDEISQYLSVRSIFFFESFILFSMTTNHIRKTLIIL